VRVGREYQLVSTITKAAIEKGMERRAATPSAANEFLKAMRTVFAYLHSVKR
jgi:hypothetical protein